MPKPSFVLLAALAALAGCARLARAPEAPALLIRNARVFDRPDADAVLVRGERIAAVGKARELARSAAGARALDAGGGLLVPGFHDAHAHLQSGGLALDWAALEEAESEAEAVELVRRHAAAHPGRTLLRGRGWAYEIVPKGSFPSRRALDAAVGDRPVVLESFDGHAYWVNSAALAAAGIGPGTPEPESGRIVREADGKTPSGALLELESLLFERLGAAPSREEALAALERGLALARSLGVTAMDSMASDEGELELLAELHARGRLPLRMTVSLPLGGDLDRYDELRRRHAAPMLSFGFLKVFVDGAIEARTAYLLEPYAGGGASSGRPLLPPEELFAQVEAAHCRGFRVAMHATGDAGVRLALDAVERARAGCPDSPAAGRHRVEHIEVAHPVELGRFAALGVVASMQPYHAVPADGDPDAGAWAGNLGPERLRRSFPWRALAERGATLAFGSDWPVMSMDPLRGLAVAATRRNEKGNPPSGWYAQHAITAAQAVRAYAEGGWLALGREAELGRIAPGMLADLTLLSPDAKLEEPATLWKTKARAVVVNGVLTELP